MLDKYRATRKLEHCPHKRFDTVLIEGNSEQYAYYQTTLACPNEAGNGLQASDFRQEDAIQKVKGLAVAAACGACVFHNKTELQVLQLQTEVSDAKAALAAARSREIEEAQKLEKLTQAGAADVNAINEQQLGDNAPLLPAAPLAEAQPAPLLPTEPPTNT